MSGCHAATVTRCDSRADFDVCPCCGYSAAGEPFGAYPCRDYSVAAGSPFGACLCRAFTQGEQQITSWLNHDPSYGWGWTTIL